MKSASFFVTPQTRVKREESRRLATNEVKRGSRLFKDSAGQSLIEVAVMLPILLALTAYAVDFGYFLIVAAHITGTAHNAAQYSVLGYLAPGEGPLPIVLGANNTSVTGEALGDMISLNNSSTTASIQVCSKNLGLLGFLATCTSYGPATPFYTPNLDPEAPFFVLNRVDITYTVQPPIPMSFFKVSLLPTMQFHRQVSMRALD